MLYVGDGSGTIYAANRETGTEQWRYRTGRRVPYSDTVLFFRYLASGGKAVWLSVPPLVWPKDPWPALASGVWTSPAATSMRMGVG
jgi:hypothetical protein